MNLAEFSIKNKVISVIVILICLVGGWNAYQTMPRLEDPDFTIRMANIYTAYPGASAAEVELEISQPLVTELQKMQEVDTIKSTSTAGMSKINVEIKYEFSSDKDALAAVWAKLRNKVDDARLSLPPNAGKPLVQDDFGDIYGMSYLITGDGFSPTELLRYAESLEKEILQVEGVSRVQLMGEQKEAIFVEISREQLVSLGSSIGEIYDILEMQNAVIAAGKVNIGDQRLVIDPTGSVDTVESIKNLLVSASPGGKVVRLGDIANVYRGYQTPPQQIILYNGKPAIAFGVANVVGGNVVVVAEAVEQRIQELKNVRPLGIEISSFYNQGYVVQKSVSAFVLNVLVAVVIVIVTLVIFMDFRAAIVIGFVLVLTISATLLTMNLLEIPLHRISLGALIIALGMMVDNAIVVTEGILVGMKRGIKKIEIAKKVVRQTQWPLLGGTLVGIIAFAPIGFAPGSTAEYVGHLFWVVFISLMFSWIFAITVTPLLCHWLFPEAKDKLSEEKDNFFIRYYKKIICGALKMRWVTIGMAALFLAAAAWGSQFMEKGFFPNSTTPQLVVDYWLPEGTMIERTAKDMKEIEAFVREMDNVKSVKTMIGQGGIRYMLTYSPESPNSAYGQLLINVEDYKKLDAMMPKIQAFIGANYPDADAKSWRFIMGPGGGNAIEAEFRGPDPEVLRNLANQATDIMRAERTLSVKTNWREMVAVIEPVYSEIKGRRAGVSRQDLANALEKHYSGRQVGVFREDDHLVPIIVRSPETVNATIYDIKSIQVLSSGTGAMVPIMQVTDGFRTIWRDGLIETENRIYVIKAQCDPYPDELTDTLLSRMRPDIEAIELPVGYTLEWGGELKNSIEANEDLMSTIPLSLLAMVLVVFILFGTVKQPVLIWLVVPGLFIGVVFGLVVTGIPLEFMGIVGILSLSGLLIKNAIVLVDQMDIEVNSGKARFDAVVDAAVSRLRPVMMGTITTVLGVIPLFFDAFFQSMTVVLVFGLLFATMLTLVVLPVLYAVFLNVKTNEIAA